VLEEKTDMRHRLLAGSALMFVLALAMPACAAEDTAADEKTLREAKIPTDGPALLQHLRNHAVDEAKIKSLIKQLGDDSFVVREGASKQLAAIGPRALKALEEAASNPDPEIGRRARECANTIKAGGSADVLGAVIRVLVNRRPAGTVEALLKYLPTADDDHVAEEVRAALVELAVRDGKVEPALLAALTDANPIKRGAAGVAVARTRVAEHLPAVRKLLDDPDPRIRLRVAFALTRARDKEAVAVLIRLLDQLPADETGLVEDLLLRLAHDKGPAILPGSDEDSRKRYREAWEKWWKENQGGIEAAQLEQATRSLGYTLVVLLDDGVVMDLDATNRPRWRINGLQKPLDVQLLPGEDRVLIAEHDGNRVTERDLKGDIKWQMEVTGPLAAQRLANGNTFIIAATEMMEVDKDRKVISRYSRPDGGHFMKGQKLRNGDIACIVQLGVARYVRLTPDAAGSYKDVGAGFGVDVHTSGGRLDVLPNGNILIAELQNNVVKEVTPEGKEVHSTEVVQPVAALRLPNGHLLVTSMTEHRAIEFDRAGKEVWQFKHETRVTRAFRR
jgi:hypothetical protein